MPYNTRRKSLSLPSLGIHIPVTHAARAAAAAAAAAASTKATRRPHSPSSSSSSSSPATSAHLSDSSVDTMDSHLSKRLKRSHGAAASAPVEAITEQTPPPSPAAPPGVDMSDLDVIRKVDLEGINDDIVEASIVQLQSTANRPHLIKELATVLTQTLSSVQQSANPCAIISSRLTSYMKRPCWTALAPCPLAKELETVHPRRTYFFLTTCPRQNLPDSSITQPIRLPAVVTPSVSLTDDSGSDDADGRRRELSPSPEVDLSSPEFDDMEDDAGMPITPIGSFKSHSNRLRHGRDLRRDSPPLETDEREFTQTADILQKRKFIHENTPTGSEMAERNSTVEYGYRDDVWFGDRALATVAFFTSPAIKPSPMSTMRKDDDADSWLKLSKLFEWDRTAESIEIDELDCLLDAC
ncbi:uncharacterized protein MAM_00700 [Metarhizium album ARSEF 1941]|uniref:GDS1 winged helix domain-containing protein n=1 Tax=Metarhizium album (strain ARSEF 1941) TaxID=1081103 RepID=A0A0B2X5P0_METAS|nr:uncharacterized protein MAM_00700 [Metarhizium album ARSEF 1941]KHO01699.1 hypothetical protein MAM_00700 [Metarhizium album ARSEF 1941]